MCCTVLRRADIPYCTRVRSCTYCSVLYKSVYFRHDGTPGRANPTCNVLYCTVCAVLCFAGLKQYGYCTVLSTVLYCNLLFTASQLFYPAGASMVAARSHEEELSARSNAEESLARSQTDQFMARSHVWYCDQLLTPGRDLISPYPLARESPPACASSTQSEARHMCQGWKPARKPWASAGSWR